MAEKGNLKPSTLGWQQTGVKGNDVERLSAGVWRLLGSIAAARDLREILENGLGAISLALGHVDILVANLSTKEGEQPLVVCRGEAAAEVIRHLRTSHTHTSQLEISGAPLLCRSPDEVQAALAQLSLDGRQASAEAMRPCLSSAILTPLECNEKTCGYVLAANSDPRRPLDGSDAMVMSSVVAIIATAVDRSIARRALASDEWQKMEVVAALSHQMRTPLASVKGYVTALLLQGAEYDGETRRQFLEVIDEETDHLTRLIADLLESSAIDAGLMRIERQPVLFPRLVENVVREMALRKPAYRFVVSFPPRFPVQHVDPVRIEQVLTNLLDNAVKYSPEGSLVTVRGEFYGELATISIADQGVGIAPEHLNRLFERFYRVKADGGRPVAGTGLGLPIARAIVEAHGGEIWAESTLGHGSTFCFTLPFCLDDCSGDEDVY